MAKMPEIWNQQYEKCLNMRVQRAEVDAFYITLRSRCSNNVTIFNTSSARQTALDLPRVISQQLPLTSSTLNLVMFATTAKA